MGREESKIDKIQSPHSNHLNLKSCACEKCKSHPGSKKLLHQSTLGNKLCPRKFLGILWDRALGIISPLLCFLLRWALSQTVLQCCLSNVCTWALMLFVLSAAIQNSEYTHIHAHVVTYPAYFLLPMKMNESAPSPVCYGPHIHVCMLIAQLCLTLCDSVDCSLQGSSVHGILQARILERVAIPFSEGFSRPREQTRISSIAGGFYTVWVTREAQHIHTGIYLTGGSQALTLYDRKPDAYMWGGGLGRGQWWIKRHGSAP